MYRIEKNIHRCNLYDLKMRASELSVVSLVILRTYHQHFRMSVEQPNPTIRIFAYDYLFRDSRQFQQNILCRGMFNSKNVQLSPTGLPQSWLGRNLITV